MGKNVRIGYLRPENKNRKIIFSATVNIGNFIKGLSRYADIMPIPDDFMKISIRKLKSLSLDYLLADAEYFTPEQFIWRERYQIDTPFIIKLVVICPLLNAIIYSIPLLRKNDVIIAPSQYAKKSFLRLSDEFKVDVVPNFVDVKFISKYSCLRSQDNRKVITYMGRITKEKGIGVLIECLPEIIGKVNNAHLNIIGPLSGSVMSDNRKSPYLKELVRQIKKHGLSDRVHFLGTHFGPDKYRLLSQSDVFVNPTTAIEELFPVANIEALACAVPVIASNWAGNKEIVRDGENGCLVDVEYGREGEAKINAAQLTSLIVNVLKDKGFNLKLRKNAAQTAQKYDYRKIAPRFAELLKKRKTRVKVKNRWNLIKNRKVTDFPRLFNKEFLFFIHSCCIADFKSITYGFLYKFYAKTEKQKRIFRGMFSKKLKRINNKRSGEANILSKKIYNECMDFLLLKKGGDAYGAKGLS